MALLRSVLAARTAVVSFGLTLRCLTGTSTRFLSASLNDAFLDRPPGLPLTPGLNRVAGFGFGLPMLRLPSAIDYAPSGSALGGSGSRLRFTSLLSARYT